jgi:non-specific serine/threonine protein kinase
LATAIVLFALELRKSLSDIATICRHLDGIPLAIELAAASAVAIGVAETTVHINDRFVLLTHGRRTAPPRHRTLRSMLDWSYNLLSATERTVLQRLAVFAGAFIPRSRLHRSRQRSLPAA